MVLERGGDNVWRERVDKEGVAPSPEDAIIAREDVEQGEDRIDEALDKMEKDAASIKGDDKNGQKEAS